MERECSVLGPVGHAWRRHGTYRRKDGTVVQRWQCGECELTTTRRPDMNVPPASKRGPARGHTVTHPDGRGAFWSELAAHALRVGLHAGAKIAARAVGVDRSTASRWLRVDPTTFNLDLGGRWSALWDAMSTVNGHFTLPTAEGVREWRRITGWRYFRGIEGYNFPEPAESRELRRQSHLLWVTLLKAAASASIVLGDPSPLNFSSLLRLTSDRVELLREGGLLARPARHRHFRYWLKFAPFGSVWTVSAWVCTRSRVIGHAIDTFRLTPPMTVRLGLDHAKTDGSRILIPVPSATKTFHRTPLTFPLELDFEDPEAVAAWREWQPS